MICLLFRFVYTCMHVCVCAGACVHMCVLVQHLCIYDSNKTVTKVPVWELLICNAEFLLIMLIFW